jgi:isopentenyl diphosphate isomerase/L-lactate dehydrogenase-like FMN-dependent dehydrogenase
MTGTPQRALSFFAGGADFATLSEIVEVARAGLASDVRDFLDGGAGREVTLRRNRRAFERWAYRPRVMTGLGVPDLATSFLGIGLGLWISCP